MTGMYQPATEAPAAAAARRRAYWQSAMERAFETQAAMRTQQVEECGEGLASIADGIAAAGLEVQFSETRIAGSFPRLFYIRESLLPPLVAIAREMNDRGWILRIEEGFRTIEMQRALITSPEAFAAIVRCCAWESARQVPPADLVFRRAQCLVANYPLNGTHMYGAAVDVSVYDRDSGEEVSRGEPYLHIGVATPMDSPFVSDEARANRREITAMMERHGFMHYHGEFWHYNQGDVLYEMVMESGRPARFGPVHWCPEDQTVRPYEDMHAPLVSLENLEQAIARVTCGAGGDR